MRMLLQLANHRHYQPQKIISNAIGSVTGANDAAKGAQKATDAQLQGVRESNDLLREFNQQARGDNQPFLNAGYSGLNRLLFGLGLGGSQNGSAAPSQMTADQIRAELLPQYSTAATQGGPSQQEIEAKTRNGVYQYGIDPTNGRAGYYTQTESGGDNSQQVKNWEYVDQSGGQPGGVNEAALNQAIQERLAAQQQAQQQYQQSAGAAGGGDLLATYKPYEEYTADKFQADPGYQFRLDQGNNALTQSLASGGNLNSGRALKALTDYNSGAASQEFNNAYGRYNNDYQTGFNAFNTNQTNQYNKLMGLVGVGQGAGQQMANSNMQTGNALANNAIQGGNAAGAGAIAQGNATSNGFNSLLGMGGLALGAYGAFGGGASAFGGGVRQGMSMYGSGAASNGLGLTGWSDRRLKRNIRRIGTHASGLPWYAFDYIWGESSEGVMADEAIKVRPNAVIADPSGFYKVNYGAL